MKIDKYIKKIISDPSKTLKERVFVVLTLSATVVCAIALLGDIIYRDSIAEIMVLIATTAGVPVITLVSVRMNKVDAAIRVISFFLIFIILPIVFYYGGGTEGAVIPWMIFAYLYIGLVHSGIQRIAGLIVLTVTVIGIFIYGYYHPELSTVHTREIGYIDTALSVIEVGYICFIMTWFQNLLNAQESKMAKEEMKKVEDLSRSQNRFFSNMSHEIRTPINSILGLNEVILKDPSASESIKKDAGNIQGAGRMLLALINDILDFSKIEAGKMEIVPVNYNVAELVSDIVNMIWHRAEEKGLKFNVEIDPTLPSELYGDEMRIRQILINLLNNAVKYTKEGSVTLHIEKETQEEDQIVLLFSVSDTGIGIKQEVIPFLFDAFRRVDEGKNAGIEGTGLGLSIVKQLVDLMGGRIAVDSIYTQGSTFTVTLRQRVTRSDIIGSVDIGNYGKTQNAVDHAVSFTAKDARVLIVDDSVMNLRVEKKLLERTGITVDTAKSGEEALTLTRTERYDVILMDHLMPEMDGIVCMQHIRTQVEGLNNKIPIIVLTANAESENRQMYSQSGFDDYLSKPVTGSQLEEMLLAHLPASKVERIEDREIAMVRMNTSRDYSRKIPVLVTCAGTCDLPVSVIRKYQLDTIPYTVTSQGRTFYDGIEASGDELVRYLNEGRQFECDPPTVEDYRTFFGSRLKFAHNIIYISGGAGLSAEYERACEAARSYDNVAVIDSQACSTVVGFLMLIGQKMSSRGEKFENIIDEIEKVKKKIRCSFVLDSIFFLQKIGPVNEGIAAFLHALNVRLVIRYKNDRFAPDKFILGGFERYYKRFIDHMLSAFTRPDKDIAVVVYAQLTDEQKEKIRTYLMRSCDFSRIVFQRTSAILPIHMGTDAFALVFFEKGEHPYDIGRMFEEDTNDTYEEIQTTEVDMGRRENIREDKSFTQNRWYEGIPGIDTATGLRNSGSDEIYGSVIRGFYDSVDSVKEEITGFVKKRNWNDFTVRVHALKSTALLAGATELAEAAQALEKAGKSEDEDYILENTDKVMEHLMQLKASIAKVIPEEDQE